MPDLLKAPPLSRLLGRRTLIIGDVGTGKTLLTALIVRRLVETGLAHHITIIDMAPKRRGKIGGRIVEFLEGLVEGLTYLTPPMVYAPRLTGKTAIDVIDMALANVKALRILLQAYLELPTRILVINDVSIYFQAGNLSDVLECVERAETFIGNGYYGLSLLEDRGSGVSMREREIMEEFMKHMDVVLTLKHAHRKPLWYE